MQEAGETPALPVKSLSHIAGNAELPAFKHNAAVYNCHHDLYLVDVFRIDLENIAREDHNVSELAGCDSSFSAFLKFRKSGPYRVGADSFFNRDLFLAATANQDKLREPRPFVKVLVKC